MIDALSPRVSHSRKGQSLYASTCEPVRPGVSPITCDRGRYQVVVAAFPHRPPPQRWSAGYRPPSPRHLGVDHRHHVRSSSPVGLRSSSPPPSISPEIEQALEKLVVKFRLRNTHKRQVCLLRDRLVEGIPYITWTDATVPGLGIQHR